MTEPLISMLTIPEPATPAERPPQMVYLVRVVERGGVILSTLRFVDDNVTVIDVERPEATLAAFNERLRALTDDFPVLPPNTRVVIDAEGLGSALWESLHVERRRGWQLYDKRGRDRQELADSLRVAQLEQRIKIRHGEHDEALRKALLSYRVEVNDDGVIGAELVVALCLAVVGRRQVPPRIY